jgi:alkaline phosphatase
MKHPCIAFLLSMSIVVLSGCHRKLADTTTPTKTKTSGTEIPVKNIILLIGDGMGLTQITAGLYSNNNRLELERFKIIGFQKPYANNKLVTDSAASATAFSCGKKTYNGAIGVDPDTIPCRTILEWAETKGWATGMVVTSTIVHATPASFIAHTSSRQNYEEIAAAFPGSGLDYFVGGGLKYFKNRTADNRDITQELKAEGYQISDYFEAEYASIKPDVSRPFGFLTSHEDPLPVENGRDYFLPATKQALNFLSQRSPKGFFLMIEGSQIDWGGHANNGPYIVQEMIEFDKAIGLALDFAARTPGTLVIVTADHEAGGCAIQPESTWEDLKFGFTTPGHTGTMIPVFAYGPGADRFGGIYENTAIYDKMIEALGW